MNDRFASIIISLLALVAFHNQAVDAQTVTAGRVYGQGGSFSISIANNGGISASSISVPTGITLDAQGGLYAADTGNNRVLYYPSGATTATRVYGQGGSFTSNTANNGGVTANSLNGPTDIAVDASNNVYIADRLNHRVLFYPSGSTTATAVYGQAGSVFTNTPNNGGISANSLSNPSGVTIDSIGRLFVADASNNRVLGFASGSTTATIVYGQSGLFNTASSSIISANSLNSPQEIRFDSAGNAYIADGTNNRVLFYLVGSTTATRVYGQGGSFTSGACCNAFGLNANALALPKGIDIDTAGQLYITDSGNNRVLRYPASGSTTADLVYGQGGSFTSNAINLGGVGAASLNSPFRVRVVGNSADPTIYVSDGNNNRILAYLPAATPPTTSPTGTSPPSSSNVCFHVSTQIDYMGKLYSYADLLAGKEPACRVPHTVTSSGVELSFTCPDKEITLTLTPDHFVQSSQRGFVSAADLKTGDKVSYVYYTDAGYIRLPHRLNCVLKQTRAIAVDENGGQYFGLNCLISTVNANGIETSTFGRYHKLPSLWMAFIGNLLGIEKASIWGDSIVEQLVKYGLH